MRNYFGKTLLAFFMAATMYLSIDSTVLIKDSRATTALITFISLLGLVIYSAYNSKDLGNG